jgi:CheY-like chemotaxis protein
VYTPPSIAYHLAGDSMRLTQILVNLIGNAIKFTNEGKVTVFCDIEKEEKSFVWLAFSIKDTGIGVPNDKAEKIFERFTQADTDTTRKYGGTGLGLSITKQLIGLLGGTISMQSVEGKGTEFQFSLPFKKVTEQMCSNDATDIIFDLDTTKTVLVVEDNYMNQKLTSIILQNNGLPYCVVENGREAVAFLKEKKADVILMDLQMPVMDGYQATCVIRDELRLNTPIIAMTAHALAGEKEKCFQLGVNDYLPKPFTERELLQKLAQWTVGKKENTAKRLIDLSFLVKQTRNNKVLIEEMVTLFRNQFAQEIDQLRTAVKQGDYQATYKTAHLVRNGIALFGLTPLLGDDLLAIEKYAYEQTDIEDIRRRFEKIEAVSNQVIEELNEMDIATLL